MKVVWLAPYPPDALIGTAELITGRWYHPAPWLVTLADALVATGEVDLTVVSLSRAVSCTHVGRTDGRDYHVLRAVNGYAKLASGYLWDTSRLLRIVEQLDPDVVHAHGTEQEYGLAAGHTRRPSLLTIQGFMNSMSQLNPGWTTYRSWSYRTLAGLESNAIRGVDGVVAHTSYAEQYVADIAPEAHVHRIPNAVAPLFMTQEDVSSPVRPCVLFVGQLVPEKGVLILLEAVSELAERGASFDLVLVGPGAITGLPTRLQELVAHGAGGVRVEVVGAISQAEVASRMRQANMLVLPSLAENAPTVIMEAMAVGLPVVASRTGGIPDLVADGVHGVLVAPCDVGSLVSGLSILLDSPELQTRLGANGRARAMAEYRPEIVATRIVNLYQEVIQTCQT